jgi:hypothetical protein
MSIKYNIANIANRYISSDTKVIYKPYNNLFDIIVGNLPVTTYIVSTDKEAINSYNVNYISPVNYVLNQYNVEFGNYDIAEGNRHNIGMNKISCVKIQKPQFIKKEDLYLINQNSANIYKIFFSKYVKDSWRFTSNSHYIKYGVPDIFYRDETIPRINKLLVFNFDNKNMQMVESVLKDNDISYDVITKITPNIVSVINEYTTCLEMTDNNIINLICASACGCRTLTPNANNISSDFTDIDGLSTFNSLETMVSEIKKVMSMDEMQDNKIKEKYSFDKFATNILSIIHNANKEVSIL